MWLLRGLGYSFLVFVVFLPLRDSHVFQSFMAGKAANRVVGIQNLWPLGALQGAILM